MVSSQNYGPFLGTLNTRGRLLVRISPEGTLFSRSDQDINP